MLLQQSWMCLIAITTLTKLLGRNIEVDSSSFALDDGRSFWLDDSGTNLISSFSSSSSSSSLSSLSRVMVWSSLKRTFLALFSPRENFRFEEVRMKSLGRDCGSSMRSLEGLSTEIGSGVNLYRSGRQSQTSL